MFQSILSYLQDNPLQILLLGISLGFLLGIIFNLLFTNQRKGTSSPTKGKGDEALFKGIQYILSNNTDGAIEEFTKSVKINSETIETYIALANLYRSKGDIDRAIRIRQSIILRPNIDLNTKIQALIDMGIDYRKGGLYNRAIEIFNDILKRHGPDITVCKELERIYEETNDWENAFQMRKKIASMTGGEHNHILAHHQTEIGKKYHERGEYNRAQSAYKKAISIHKGCVDAYLHLGDLYFENREYKKAIATWKKVVDVAPRFTFLAYRRLENAYARIENLKPVEEFLKECTKLNPDPFTYLALARYLYNERDIDGALQEIEKALKLAPYFWEARRLQGEILLNEGMNTRAISSYKELVEHLHIPYLEYQCSKCGFKPSELQWQCPQCKNWDSIELLSPKEELPSQSPDLNPEKITDKEGQT